MSLDLSDRGVAVNAVIGALATVVLSFLLVSPLFGGTLAGYLENGSRREGAIVGAFSGFLVAVVADALLVGLSFLVPVRSGIAPVGFVGGPVLVLLVAALVVTGYLVGLGAVGGVLGTLVREWRAG